MKMEMEISLDKNSIEGFFSWKKRLNCIDVEAQYASRVFATSAKCRLKCFFKSHSRLNFYRGIACLSSDFRTSSVCIYTYIYTYIYVCVWSFSSTPRNADYWLRCGTRDTLLLFVFLHTGQLSEEPIVSFWSEYDIEYHWYLTDNIFLCEVCWIITWGLCSLRSNLGMMFLRQYFISVFQYVLQSGCRLQYLYLSSHLIIISIRKWTYVNI
jgi:hypothetical protein